MNSVRPDDTLSMVEASAVTDLPGEVLRQLMAGPFAPVDERVTLRKLLGVAVLVELCMLPPDTALHIAYTAACDAQPDSSRMLSVAWLNDEPKAAWTNSVTDALRRPILLLPAERMFTTIAARCVAYRDAAARPN